MTIHFVAPEGSEVLEVDRTEVLRDGLRHRIKSVGANRSLRAVFSDDFSELLESILEKRIEPSMVFTDRSISFEHSSGTVQQLQMVANLADDNRQRVTLRFTKVTGKIQDLFRDVTSTTQSEPRNIAIAALERVVARAYDASRVCAMLPDQSRPQDMFERPLRKILSKREELLFRLELLQRAVKSGWSTSDLDSKATALIHEDRTDGDWPQEDTRHAG